MLTMNGYVIFRLHIFFRREMEVIRRAAAAGVQAQI